MARATSPPSPGQLLRLPVSAAPLLLRIPVTSPTWAESMPPMPTGAGITVAFSDPDVEAEHGDAVALLGYPSVGVLPPSTALPPSIDLLIPRTAADRWPLWRDAVLSAGGRVWDLAFGPVAMKLASAVAVHERD